MKENDRMNSNQVKEQFVKYITNNYVLNLAVSVLETLEDVGVECNRLLIERMHQDKKITNLQKIIDEIEKYCLEEREDINGGKCDDVLKIIKSNL